jgi:elongation factor Ts
LPAVTVELIKSLREQTGAGISDCKQALEDNGGNLEQAMASLRQKGFEQAAKRADRETSQGLVEAYIHTGGRVGAMVQLGCETDFVARTEGFRTLAHDIAMQVAAMSPVYLNEADMDEGDDRPAAQVCLMQQPFIKDGSRTLADLVRETAAQTGENVRVVSFRRLALGE